MGELLVEILTVLSNFSPIGAIALLSLILFFQLKSQKDSSNKLNTITDNHLHELPQMAESLRRIEDKLEVIANNLLYLVGKLNGGGPKV